MVRTILTWMTSIGVQRPVIGIPIRNYVTISPGYRSAIVIDYTHNRCAVVYCIIPFADIDNAVNPWHELTVHPRHMTP